jgi:uncharacterized protein (DUF2237 family)
MKQAWLIRPKVEPPTPGDWILQFFTCASIPNGSPFLRLCAQESSMPLNVLGSKLDLCEIDPLIGYFRDGSCKIDERHHGSHAICAVMTREFPDHQSGTGNDFETPMPQHRFPGLVPGDRWCVTARNWLTANDDGVAGLVVLASCHGAVHSQFRSFADCRGRVAWTMIPPKNAHDRPGIVSKLSREDALGLPDGPLMAN